MVLLWHGSGPDERDVLAPLAAEIAGRGRWCSSPTGSRTTPVAGPVQLLARSRSPGPTAGELGGDPGRIVLAGWSLGANAAACRGRHPDIVDGWHPSGLVGLAGSYDGSPFGGRPVRGRTGGPAPDGRRWWPTGPRTRWCRLQRSVEAADRLAGLGWPVVLRQVDTDHAGIIGTEYDPWRRSGA